MENTKIKKVSLLGLVQVLIALASVAMSIYFYQHFPTRVPTHWGLNGQVDSWGSRGTGAFLLPALIIVIYFLFALLPKIDPRKDRYVEFAKTYSIFKTAIMTVLLAVYIATGLNVLGYPVSISFWIPFVIGLLFVVLGNYFGKLRNNYFVGIRTPWTLSNEEVWNRTHRFGGKMFILGGIIMMLSGFVPTQFRMPIFIVSICAIVILPIFYSYIEFKRLQK